jgi:transitional endoplasmic reticulum ATPase
MTGGFNGADLTALVNTAVSIVLQAYVAKYPKPEDAKKHLTEAVVTYEHFQEAAKKVRSSRDSNPMKNVTAPFYK